MGDDPKSLKRGAGSSAVSAFLDQLAKTPSVRTPGTVGRLVFALDATMSRQPTWDIASGLQKEMFETAASIGGLEIQLVSFRGMGEFDVRPWTARAADLTRAMSGYHCRGGFTQIERVLKHGNAEVKKKAVKAIVYVGDAFEEDADRVCHAAGQLGLAGVPVFAFQEGADARTRSVFQEMARLTRGAYCRFDAGAADALRDLLKAVAIFASGGLKALEAHAKGKGGAVRLLTQQMRGKTP